MGLIEKLFGTTSSREIKKIMPLVDHVLSLEGEYQQLTDEQLIGKTADFRRRLDQGSSLDELLPEAFATVREASSRVLGMRHFPVQLIGGTILHQGRIAEMKTGEGKTLVATLPVYLNALEGKGVHVVTVNDYLAKRDSEWMGKVYHFLGLSVGLIVHGLNNAQRRQSYQSDITYGTNNEFGFDYLRDNMAVTAQDRVQRPLNFAIVDEVDSILIDEARTPLIISGQGSAASDLYDRSQQFVSTLRKRVFKEIDNKMDFDESEALEKDADYLVDEKAKTAVLTPNGVQKAERFFQVENLTDPDNYQVNHHINNALKANGIMHRDQDYVVRGDEIVIVDENTGRLMEGRRYSNGLHQAIEAKEHVHVKRESRTLATITFQNYFRLYNKLSGMTGTAMTEQDEFREIYQLDVVEIPTNKPMVRSDEEDEVYKNRAAKYARVMEEVKAVHNQGQPILIGTTSVERSEFLSDLFQKNGIEHNVLNAKQHEREAEIVSQAGRLGQVTISTNMAGRGTDIMLGGNPTYLARQEMKKLGYDEELIEEADAFNETSDPIILEARERFRDLESHFKVTTDREKEAVVNAGGLYIMGTERHESRRIDNQLRGRAGRQGDPGRTKFFLSFEDDLMRLFGGEMMDRILNTMGFEEDTEIHHPLLTKSIEMAQKRVESQNFAIRKHVLEYDDVMNKQREIIYHQRSEVLEGKDLHDFFVSLIRDTVESVFVEFCHDPDPEQWDREALVRRLQDLFGDIPSLQVVQSGEYFDPEGMVECFQREAVDKLEARSKEFGGKEVLQEAERIILLSCVDDHWMEHIDAMDTLRDSIGLRAYGQQDPVIAYQKEGYDMFEAMTQGIQEDAVRLIMRAHLTQQPSMNKQPVGEMSEGRKQEASALNRAQSMAGQPGLKSHGGAAFSQGSVPQKSSPVKREITLGRNDPCWCGSGKKYKNCHMNEDLQKGQ